MKKMIRNIIVACAITFSFASCLMDRCPAFPPEIAPYLLEQENSVCFTNSNDTVCFSVQSFASGVEDIYWDSKALCDLHCVTTYSYYPALRDTNKESMYINIYGEIEELDGGNCDGPESLDFSKNMHLILRKYASYGEVSVEDNDTCEFRFTPSWEIIESPWSSDTLWLDCGLYDSVCFVKNQGMVSFYNRQDSTTWRRVMP